MSSFGGGLAGLGIFAGITSGFFATAGNASRIFLANNFVKARLWGSLAAAVIRQNLVNSWATFMLHTRVGLSMWGAKIASSAASWFSRARFGAFLTSKNCPARMEDMGEKCRVRWFNGCIFQWLPLCCHTTSPEDRAWKDFLIETVIGGASGVLLSPFLLVKTLKTGGKLFLAGYAGLENFLIEGLKTGEWTWHSAAIGVAAGIFVGYVVSPMLTNGMKLLKGLFNGGKTDLNTLDDIIVDNITKPFGADMRSDLNDIFDNYDINGPNEGKDVSDHKPKPDPQIEPKQTPDMDPKPEPHQIQNQSHANPKPEPQPRSETGTNTRSKKPEPTPDPKPDHTPDPKPEPTPQPTPIRNQGTNTGINTGPTTTSKLRMSQQKDRMMDKSQMPEDEAVNLDETENDGHSSDDVNDREQESSVSENQTSTNSNRFDGPQPSFAK